MKDYFCEVSVPPTVVVSVVVVCTVVTNFSRVSAM